MIDYLVQQDNMLVAHAPKIGVMFTTGGKSTLAAAKPTMPRVDQQTSGNLDVEYWGETNDFPQQVIEMYSRNTLIPRLLGDKVAELVGGGLIAMKLDPITKAMIPVEDPEIVNFLEDIQVNRAVFEMANDLLWFFNGWVELIPSVDRTKIVGFVHQEASFCRWSKQNAAGKCENVLLSADWPNPNKDHIVTLPVIDPYAWDSIDRVRNGKGNNFLYPYNHPTVGKTFYQLAYHDAVRTSGWLDILQSVPAFKKYLLKNSMTIKYHFQIDEAYWPAYFGEDKWEELTPEDQIPLKRKWLEQMTKTLTDVENAGNSIITPKIWDDQQVKDYRHLITIDELNESTKDGSYIEDVGQANSQLLYAFGADPTTIGFSGGGDQAQRSGGSDKREAWLIANLRLQPTRNFLLEPIRWIAKYNGWDARHNGFKIMTKDSILTTTDTGFGAKQVNQ